MCAGYTVIVYRMVTTVDALIMKTGNYRGYETVLLKCDVVISATLIADTTEMAKVIAS